MATFQANPNYENEPWIERSALEGYGFRNWHLMFFAFSGFATLLILICCCVKFRIPRTKQDIEGDYRRKKLAEKFQERLKAIQQNQEMDALDLQTALRIIQEDFDNEKRLLQEKVSLGYCDDKDKTLDDNQKSPLFIPSQSERTSRHSKRFANILLATAIKSPQ